ncbi:hypothetical protein AYI68_g8022, partial [Smittium mucronatum]
MGLIREGVSLNSATGIVMRNHELVESVEGRDSDISASITIEALELSVDLDPSVDLTGEPSIKDLVSFLLGLSLSSGTKTPVIFWHIIPTVGSVHTLSVVSSGRKGQNIYMR